jgi:hypothetical protein
MNDNYISTKIKRETNQKMKVVASLNAQTISQWLEWVVERAYESAMRNKRPHLTKNNL